MPVLFKATDRINTFDHRVVLWPNLEILINPTLPERIIRPMSRMAIGWFPKLWEIYIWFDFGNWIYETLRILGVILVVTCPQQTPVARICTIGTDLDNRRQLTQLVRHQVLGTVVTPQGHKPIRPAHSSLHLPANHHRRNRPQRQPIRVRKITIDKIRSVGARIHIKLAKNVGIWLRGYATVEVIFSHFLLMKY